MLGSGDNVYEHRNERVQGQNHCHEFMSISFKWGKGQKDLDGQWGKWAERAAAF